MRLRLPLFTPSKLLSFREERRYTRSASDLPFFFYCPVILLQANRTHGLHKDTDIDSWKDKYTKQQG